MRIEINAVPLITEQRSGISSYAYNVIKHLEQVDQKNEYYLYSRLKLFIKKYAVRL